MAARITREFLDRMRDDPDFLEATPGDASEAVAIIDLAISALSHPAALERARAEERERCAARIDEKRRGWDVLAREPGGWLKGGVAALQEAADCLRALGPRPSPEAEAPPSFGAPQAYWQAAQMEAVHRAFWNGREQGRAEATTPPALAPEMRERVARVLPAFANIAAEHESETEHDRIKVSVPLGHIRGVVRLLSALSSDEQRAYVEAAMGERT